MNLLRKCRTCSKTGQKHCECKMGVKESEKWEKMKQAENALNMDNNDLIPVLLQKKANPYKKGTFCCLHQTLTPHTALLPTTWE